MSICCKFEHCVKLCLWISIITILRIDRISCACDNNDICIDVNSTESNEISMELDDDDGEDVNDVITTNCSELCTHGSCVDTDTCLCNDGYQPSHVDKFDCEPICGEADIESIGCINGICIAPQTCECLDGFVLNGNVHPFTCTPVDGDDGHNGQVLSTEFWILMGSAVIFIGLTIAVLIVWTRRERKTIYVADGNVDAIVVKYIVGKSHYDDNGVVICMSLPEDTIHSQAID